MLEIRGMREEDLPEVCAIERETFSCPWSYEGLWTSLRADNTIYLTAWEDGKLAGYCGLMLILDEGDITNVAVKKAFRRRGIGEKLMAALLAAAAEKGAVSFTLEVRQSNAPARALYRKLGFTDCGVRKNYYEKPAEHAVIMWKCRQAEQGNAY